jgi:hypothetical protein
MQKINPVHLDVREHWCSWLIDAFTIYKSSMLTHKAIIIVALMFLLVSSNIESIIPDQYSSYYEWIHLALFRIVFCVYFITYMIGIIYKHDKNSPSLNIGFDKTIISRFIRLNMVIFGLNIISYAFRHLFSVGDAEQSQQVIEYTDFELLLIGVESFVFYYIYDFFVFCFVMLYVYMNKSFFSTIGDFNKAIFGHNNFIFAIFLSIFSAVFLDSIANIGNYSVLSYFFFLPYFLSLYYVIFKHLFFGMEPSKREAKAKNGIYSTA